MYNKRMQINQVVPGPGVCVFETRNVTSQWINNETVDIETVMTNVSIDYTYLQQQVDMMFKALIETHLKEHLTKLIQNRVSLDYIVWDDKGTLTTRVLVDGDCVLERSVEIPLMEVAQEQQVEVANGNV